MAEYTRRQILEPVKAHFEARGFHCESYYDELGKVRLPLYCFKKEDEKITEEVAVDIITESTISKETYLPRMLSQTAVIENACSVKFFQYYLPYAKVYWAYGHYVRKDNDYKEFSTICDRNGIGLIEVSGQNVSIVKESLSLNTILNRQLRKQVETISEESLNLDAAVERLSSVLENLEQEYLHYLIYYADPEYKRRAIKSREETPDLSLILINSLQEVKNLEYHQALADLAGSYRNESRDDPQIAFETIRELWNERLQIEYPDIHKEFEAVLLINPSYRDHFLHQFQVFLLGALIIDRLYDTDPIKQFEQSQGTKIENAWLAASTYHDFNYALEECENWMTDFLEKTLHISGRPHQDSKPFTFDLEKVIIREQLLEKMKGLFSSINCDVDDCILKFILGRVALNKNHAVLGALTLLSRCQNRSRLTIPAANHVAMSILLHDEKNWQYFCGIGQVSNKRPWERQFCRLKLIPQLTFDSYPLEFLLTFCDAAQEWGRVGRDYQKTKPLLENIEIDQQRILLHMSVEDDVSYDKKQREIQKLKRYLKDNRFGIEIRSRTGTISTTIWMGGL